MSIANMPTLHSELEKLFKQMKLDDIDEYRLRSAITEHYKVIGDDGPQHRPPVNSGEAKEEEGLAKAEEKKNYNEKNEDKEVGEERSNEVDLEEDLDDEEHDSFPIYPTVRCVIQIEDSEEDCFADDYELSQQVAFLDEF